MGVKFFGQFLIDQGEIDKGHLDAALEIYQYVNVPIGELAVRVGYLTSDQAELIASSQHNRDVAFGQLAIELGMLDAGQLSELLQQQKDRKVQLGAALLQIGAVSEERLEQLLDAFKLDQAGLSNSEDEHPASLQNIALFPLIMDFAPKLARRFASMRVKLGAAEPWNGSCELPHKTGAVLSEPQGLWVGISADRDLGPHLAAQLVKEVTGSNPEEGVKQFLRLILEHAIAKTVASGAPPSTFDLQSGTLPGSGWCFALVTTAGAGRLIIQPPTV